MLPVATSAPTHDYQQARRVRPSSEATLIRAALAGSQADLQLLFRTHWPRASRSAFDNSDGRRGTRLALRQREGSAERSLFGTMVYPFESGGAVSAAVRPEPAGRNRGHVVVPEALRVAARTSGPAVDRRRHPSQCLIGRGAGPAPE